VKSGWPEGTWPRSAARAGAAAQREVGFIFQAYYLLPELDALENVCLPARMARTPAA
jgi:ABC-type lipoprotein export system ATPase subunit